jgi:hypothetical protein
MWCLKFPALKIFQLRTISVHLLLHSAVSIYENIFNWRKMLINFNNLIEFLDCIQLSQNRVQRRGLQFLLKVKSFSISWTAISLSSRTRFYKISLLAKRFSGILIKLKLRKRTTYPGIFINYYIHLMRYEALTEVDNKDVIFWDVTRCRFVPKYNASHSRLKQY